MTLNIRGHYYMFHKPNVICREYYEWYCYINVSYMDMKNTISSLKNSSPDYDELSAYIAKQCIDNYGMS